MSDPQSWAYLSPILEENGGWSAFISTSRGNNHLKRMYDFACSSDNWFAQLMTAHETDVFKPEQLKSIKAEMIATFGSELGEALYNQEYLCSWEGAQPGSYYGKQISLARKDNRITEVPWTS
ncbi:MAG: hypothetical protein KKB56_13615, partial [Gammaproteobacteria bacterium]|nr:hypothetical protein [Gammaproteobacteria bacterium]